MPAKNVFEKSENKKLKSTWPAYKFPACQNGENVKLATLNCSATMKVTKPCSFGSLSLSYSILLGRKMKENRLAIKIPSIKLWVAPANNRAFPESVLDQACLWYKMFYWKYIWGPFIDKIVVDDCSDVTD